MGIVAVIVQRAFSSVDRTVMTINMAESNNWVIGTTLDTMFNSGLPSPFTEDSFEAFQAVWDNKTEWLQLGTWTMTSDIVSSQSDAVETLDIDGSLSLSYMAISGDAHMSFASENVQSASDVSVIIKAAARGKRQQMNIAETTSLSNILLANLIDKPASWTIAVTNT